MRKRVIAFALALVMVAGTCFVGNGAMIAKAEGEEPAVQTEETETTEKTDETDGKGSKENGVAPMEVQGEEHQMSPQGTENEFDMMYRYYRWMDSNGEYKYNSNVNAEMNFTDPVTLAPGEMFLLWKNSEEVSVNNFTLEGENMNILTSKEITVPEYDYESDTWVDKNKTVLVLSVDATVEKVYSIPYQLGDVTATLEIKVGSYDSDQLKICKKGGTEEYPNYSDEVQNGTQYATNETEQLYLDYRIPYGDEGNWSTTSPEGVVWKSTEPSIVSVDNNGLLSTHEQEGIATISATVGGATTSLEIEVKKAGVYLLGSDEIEINVVVGNVVPSWPEFEVVGDITPTIKDDTNIYGGYMVLEPDSISNLAAAGVGMGLNNTESLGSFKPVSGYHTFENIQGLSSDAPFIIRNANLVGCSVEGNIYYPNKNCTEAFVEEIYDWGKYTDYDEEKCTCYKPDKAATHLNKINVLQDNGTYKQVDSVHVKVNFVANTAKNTMDVLNKIDPDNMLVEQSEFLELLMFGLSNGYSFGSKNIKTPAYNSEQITKITELVNAAGICNGTIENVQMKENVSISNMLACLKVTSTVDVDDSGKAIEEIDPIQPQTLEANVTKKDAASADVQQYITDPEKNVLDTTDITITRTMLEEAGDEDEEIQTQADSTPEEVKEIGIPLQITVDTGKNIGDRKVAVVREHTDADGKKSVTAITDVEVDGSKVTFESDKFSEFNIVYAEAIKDIDTTPTDPSNPTNPDTGNNGDNNGSQGNTGNTGNQGNQGTTGTGSDSKTTNSGTAVKTGDYSHVSLWLALMAVAGVGIVVVYTRKKHK